MTKGRQSPEVASTTSGTRCGGCGIGAGTASEMPLARNASGCDDWHAGERGGKAEAELLNKG
jgi:hypothetical protein